MFSILYPQEERDPLLRDELGNFKASYSDRFWDAALYRPTINEALHKHPEWANEVSWPHGKTFAACLTHDFDSIRLNGHRELIRNTICQWKHSPAFLGLIKHSLNLVGLRHSQKNMDLFTPWMEEEKKRGFHSTFFIFPSRISKRLPIDCSYRWNDWTGFHGDLKRLREVVQHVAAEGWEIGLHGSFLSATNYDLLCEQKEDLESVLGQGVMCVRQHNLRWDIHQTPEIQEKAGFLVDSTLGFNCGVGFRSGIAYPYRLVNLEQSRSLNLFEFPLIIHDGALLRRDNLYLPLPKALEICKLLIDRVAETKGLITLLWHPDKILYPGWFDLYTKVLDYIQKKNGWGASVKEVYEWWTRQGLDIRLEKHLKLLVRS